ncbi:MAG: 3-phosphoglycerate dehydrogenase [Marinilabiliales bacterium]|nr:MAG: 3-phosphoglycerate dehydrogenase [Marinilabiliales bacterium]
MAKVLIATEKPFAPAAVQSIREIVENAGFELALLEKYTDKAQLFEAVKDADALIVRSDKITAEVVEQTQNLKIVVRAGAGYDNLDLEALTAKGVVAMNTPGQNSNAVAELALGMMVSIARNNYAGTSGSELKGKSLGIHAYGYVGKGVATIAKGFGMKVYAYDPFIDKSIMINDGVEVVDSVEELYSKCRYISLHIPANEHTKESINYNLLMSMPKGATLVNTARKEVIHEDDMLRVLSEREDFRYASDIAPDNKEIIANKFEGRFFFTPKKMGAQTSEANINAGIAAANQIVAFIKEGDRTFQVNK